eukprot:6470618-Amphidinium_carterae.1
MPRSHDFYWCCSRKGCTGWEWMRKGECRKCGCRAPGWVFQAKTGKGKAADSEEAHRRGKPTYASMAKRAAARSQETPTPPPDREADDDENSDSRRRIQAKLRKIEDSIRLLGEDAPPCVMGELSEAAINLRAQLRETAPPGKRLVDLQRGVERRQDKLAKLEKRIADIQQQQKQEATQLENDLQKVREAHQTRMQTLEENLKQARQQAEQAVVDMAELRDQQRSLVPTEEELENPKQ